VTENAVASGEATKQKPTFIWRTVPHQCPIHRSRFSFAVTSPIPFSLTRGEEKE
jgi:hypothetical protein